MFEQMIRTSDIPRSRDYMLSRLSQMTVARLTPTNPNSSTAAIAWITTHPDFSMGTLHVDPNHRRRGLAKLVSLARVQSSRSAGVPGWVCVGTGNTASEAVWKGLGWKREWDAEWIELNEERRELGRAMRGLPEQVSRKPEVMVFRSEAERIEQGHA
jgi:ribosomal protein S18 acetylase RimI-like enzyme